MFGTRCERCGRFERIPSTGERITSFFRDLLLLFFRIIKGTLLYFVVIIVAYLLLGGNLFASKEEPQKTKKKMSHSITNSEAEQRVLREQYEGQSQYRYQ